MWSTNFHSLIPLHLKKIFVFAIQYQESNMLLITLKTLIVMNTALNTTSILPIHLPAIHLQFC